MTLLLGLAYLNMAFYLFSIMGLDVDAADSSAPVLIYTLAGAHVAMTIVAMVFVGLMAFRALAGQYTSRQYDGLASAALFWHATVVVYAVIWFAVFVTK